MAQKQTTYIAPQAGEVYVKLRDKSTSFHDITQGRNIVSDRVVLFKRTAKVEQAIIHNVLDVVSDKDAEAYYKNLSSKKAVVAKEPVESEEDDEETEVQAKKAAAPKKAVASKKAAAPKKALTDDDDEDEEADDDEK